MPSEGPEEEQEELAGLINLIAETLLRQHDGLAMARAILAELAEKADTAAEDSWTEIDDAAITDPRWKESYRSLGPLLGSFPFDWKKKGNKE